MCRCRNPSLSCFPARPASANIHTLAHLRTPRKCLMVGEHLLAPAVEPRQGSAGVNSPKRLPAPAWWLLALGSCPPCRLPFTSSGSKGSSWWWEPWSKPARQSETLAGNLQSHRGSADSRLMGCGAHLPEDYARLVLVLAQPPAALPDSSLHAKAPLSPPRPLHLQCFLLLVAKTVPLLSPASTTWEPGMQSLD